MVNRTSGGTTRNGGRTVPNATGFYEFVSEGDNVQASVKFRTDLRQAITNYNISSEEFIRWAKRESKKGKLGPFPKNLGSRVITDLYKKPNINRFQLAFLQAALPLFKPEDILCKKGEVLLCRKIDDISLIDRLMFLMEDKGLDFGDLMRAAQRLKKEDNTFKIPKGFSAADMQLWDKRGLRKTAKEEAYNLALKLTETLPPRNRAATAATIVEEPTAPAPAPTQT